MRSFYSVPEDKIIETLKAIRILHVYGKVDNLLWELPDTNRSLPGTKYRINHTYDVIYRMTYNIKTIYETVSNQSALSSEIHLAKRIFFLGFGYADENLNILRIPGRPW